MLTNNKKNEVGVMLKSTESVPVNYTGSTASAVTNNKVSTPLKRMVTKKVAAKPPQAQSA
jgi:hypothetical protein